MGWYEFRNRDFGSERNRVETVLSRLYGKDCRLVDYERVPVPVVERLYDLTDYNSVYYLAVDFSKNHPDIGINAVVFLERDMRNGRSIKPLDEAMGPCACECPKRILDHLSPTVNVDALDWRRRCKQFHEEQKVAQSLSRRRRPNKLR